ncbi:centromere-associated protein E isoform X1 [Pantherophis guttatus]|uniref:Centromere-associated protein E n=1 Tax=Pantherophis guttatus TaxID=94885 RepID=A0A6P9DQW5_PANGU|nr:centromere-associated protein E isoform X1 [Pantherophis guttatus]
MAEEGGVTVCVRVRPLIARENEDLDEKGQVSWKSEDCTVSQIDGTRSFVFDRVFHSNNSTKEVYQGVTAPIIKSAVQGYNGTIFAYGQTASGKTHTILGTKDGPGILPMAINDVFNTICSIPDREFLLRISYMEIHNETIQDLLCSNIRKKKSLVVREDINRTIYVEDLNEEVVVSPEEVMSWLKKGEKNRHYGETKMNEKSSRSHTIFRMIIESKEKHTSGSSYEGAVMVSHLNFVDLGGSERASQTGAEGIRFKEGCNINRSLFILGQVIKKLCDDQSGGFINYRDSKLTRILQNSLGGNAKTVIICTITPASLEETLSTLQFASTAKKMKNTPKVNEVLDDEALLKRYRNEIEDLKRQLEEVSSHSHTKDQLAQLLEEKNSVQKEQQDRIRALTEMLVTSSSFLRERELKAKKKRRVTWAPGPVSQDGGMPFLEDFPARAKRFKGSLSCVTEMEESVSSEFSEYDDQCMTASVIMPEEEWIPGSEINFTSKDFAESVQLCQSLLEERDNAVTEQQTIKSKFDSVCLEKEQLTLELSELREKISTHEFVALEKVVSEEQEMQLMHEITNLKAIISNAEIYNQDLQQEINSKDMQCKEQEERISALEEHNKKLKSLVEEFKKDKNETTILVQTPRKNRDEVQELKQSLRDAENVALDAKKESAFLRSENLTLKEKMNQLSETYNQMEKDLGNYKTQLEAGKVTYKKMQSDLQKELQYYLQENAKLTSSVEVNNSKDLLPYMELEGKMEDLKNELNKALEENVSLKEKLTDLSEANSGSDLEILHKEIVEKNETIALLISEKEMLLSQVCEKERMVHEATQALSSKMDLANDEMIRGNTVAFEELRQSCDRLEEKSLVVAEEDNSTKTEIDSCSNGSLNTSISYNTQEQSSKTEELQKKDLEQEELLTLKEQLDEAHQKLSEMEELKDQLKVWESKMEAEEAQKSDIIERLQEDQEKIRTLTQERSDFKQKYEALEKERDQLKEDIQDTISMNIEAQEGFRNAQNSLKQCQKRIKELEETISEKDKQISRVQETLEVTIDDQKQQLQTKSFDPQQLLQMNQNAENFDDAEQLKISLESQVEVLQKENAELVQKLHSTEEDIKCISQEKEHLRTEIQHLENNSLELQQLLCLKEEESQQKVENMKDAQLDSISESQMEALQKEKTELVQKLQSTEENVKCISQEKEHLRTEVKVLQAEKDTMTQTVHHLGETLEKLVPMNLELQEQLREANNSLREHKEMVEELKGKTIAIDSQTSKIDEELKQKAEDTQLELEKLLAYVKLQEDEVHTQKNLVFEKQQMFEKLEEEFKEETKKLKEKAEDSQLELEKLLAFVKLQEDEVNTQKNLVLEKQQMFQKLEEEFKEETKKLKEKIQHLENNSLELQQLLCLKEDESQQKVENMKDAKQLDSISESQMEALQKEKTELVQKLQSTEENIKYISQEKEHLRTEMKVLQTEKDNMIQTVHRLSETIERLVPVNLELQQELREANNSLREHEEMVKELKEKIVTTDFQTLKIHEELKKKSEHSQLELEKLLMYVKSQEDEINIQKNLVLEKQQMFQKFEEEIKEETKHLKEKIIKSNEEVSSLTEEKKQLTAELREQEKCVQQLQKEKALLQKEREDLQQVMQNIGEETQSQLQETLSEKAAKIIKSNEEISSLTEEKKQLTAELREQEKCVQQVLKEKALLQKERDDLQQLMQNIGEETQSQLQETLAENAAKIIKLNEEANSLTEEKKQLTAELREQEKCVQQLLKEKALLQKERDDLQQVMQNIGKETESQLQETLSENAAKDSEMNVKQKMQDCFEILEAKIFRIMEALKKFPELEKRSEYFINISLQIKNQFDSKKALIAKWLPGISLQEANNIKRLQIETERMSNSLYSLLNKLQYFFTCLCDKRKEYYTNVSKYTRELLDERRNQHALLMQIQQLGKHHMAQQGAGSRQSGISELIQSLDGLTKQISKEVSEMEEELGSTEVTLQELECENIKMERYLERCSDYFDLQGFEATIKQNIEKFRSINQLLQPKAQPYFQARSALEAINANYCKEIDATLKACREETKELILQLDMLKKEQKSCAVPNMALEEENHKLEYKLKATEQDTKNLQLKIQELESIINERSKNLQEKEKTIATLQMKLKVRGSRSEVIKLQAALEEKENCLRNALSERETLKAQVDKGVGLYKEEIEDLRTQLAKADMARMKQSKLFDQEMANAKALADHREQQLRKLKEELRKAQQEQDVTVMSNKDLPQPFLPITCGGGSGIVQNTHILVLKSEHAKLEKEYAQLKKEHELLLTNDLFLKEEIKKWKERAVKRRERALGDTAGDHKIKSPRKAPASSLSALPASPCKERSMQPILPLDTPQLMPSNTQSSFFDNSCLGITANTKSGRTESEENNIRNWLSSEDRGDVSNCKTQ